MHQRDNKKERAVQLVQEKKLLSNTNKATKKALERGVTRFDRINII